MENKKVSIKKILTIASVEYTKWICNSKMIVLLVMLIFIKSCAIDPLLEHCEKMNEKINIIEPFIAIGNSNMLLLIIPAVFLVLMSDFPKTDGNSLFYIIRCGKINWFLGQIVFALMSILSFLGAIFLLTIILSVGKVYIGTSWSDVITKYNTLFPDDSYSFASQLIVGRIFNQMSLLKAFIHTFLLISSYLFLIILILIVFFLVNHKEIGTFINSIIMALGSAFTFIETKIMWVMPTANSLIGLHYTEIFRKPIMPVYISYLYFFIVNVILIILCLKLIKNYNISNIKDDE
ncbi:MAG: hypothetical protein MSA89_14840 [Clostridium sp.]|nr:hypothetical protein [Clostridium sp.]